MELRNAVIATVFLTFIIQVLPLTFTSNLSPMIIQFALWSSIICISLHLLLVVPIWFWAPRAKVSAQAAFAILSILIPIVTPLTSISALNLPSVWVASSLSFVAIFRDASFENNTLPLVTLLLSLTHIVFDNQLSPLIQFYYTILYFVLSILCFRSLRCGQIAEFLGSRWRYCWFSQSDELRPMPASPKNSSIIELLTFDWFTATIALGRSKPLELEDITSLSEKFSCRVSAKHKFEPLWRSESQRGNNARLLKVLWKAFGNRLVLSGLLKLVNDMLLFVSPLVLKHIIEYTQKKQENGFASSFEGLLLAFTLFASYLCQSLTFQQYFDMVSTVQVQLRGALTNAVFEKSCKLSPESRAIYTTGQIQNLMSTDVRTVADTVLLIHMLWSTLEQVTITLVLLINLLGWIPTSAGLAFLLATMPLQGYMVSWIKQFREYASRKTDERVKVISESIQGIKLVKLYAWELSFVKRILEIRAVELYFVRLMSLMQASCAFIIASLPTSLTIVAFVVYALMGKQFNSAVVFPAIALFNILRPPLLFFPATIISTARAAASLSRLRSFLTCDELKPLTEGDHAVDQTWMRENSYDVVTENASFNWDPTTSASATLTNSTFRVPEGALVVVVGPTGGGKSTLLAGLLGEVPITSGHVGVHDEKKISFCHQVAFIRNETVRANILFGKPFDAALYERVLDKCSLKSDLTLLPAGDQTEIGGRGVNLSGGQRARISLARAVYSQAEICLLDDPLCAVDARVGNALFKNCIVSELRGKTRILTTNQLQFAASPAVDFIVVVKNGIVIESGTREQLFSKPDSEFTRMISEAGDLAAVEEANDSSDSEPPQIIRIPSRTSPLSLDDFSPVDSSESDQDMEVIESSSISQSSDDKDQEETSELLSKQNINYGALEAGKLTQKEGKNVGRVQLKHYKSYISSMGLFQWVIPSLLFALVSQAFSVLVNVWLSMWSDTGSSFSQKDIAAFLFTFIALGILTTGFAAGSEYAQAFGSIRASILIHEKLLLSVFGAPSSFFGSTPEGRLVNRFNSDMDNIDSLLAATLQSFLRLLLALVCTLGIILWVTPAFIFFVVPVGAMCLYIQEFYRKSSVDLRRLESLSRSPLYSHFGETLDGIVTIRAYEDISWAVHKSNAYTDQLSKASYSTNAANRWLAIRLEGLGTILIFSATLLALLAPIGKIPANVIGLLLAYVMQILGAMTWTVRQFTETESQMNAIERVAEYSEQPFAQEEKGGLEAFMKELKNSSGSLTGDESMGLISTETVSQLNLGVRRRQTRWPKRGHICFENVEMRYRKDLEPSLKRVSFSVQPGEHVGIVGRTGAGKSSAIQSLFRLYELDDGRITIDDADISKMRLFDLRSSLGIIPQEPICFSGTIRSNLDMFNEHSDDMVQRALDACGIQDTMRQNVGLYTKVSENGGNLSIGQRQLLCLGRALLKDSQILVLDEATSSVSHSTDERFQKTLREEMNQCTILTVAHRLHTIIQYDKIIVMDKGRIAEMGSPAELLSYHSMFSELVDETGSATAAHLRQLANCPRNKEFNVDKDKMHSFSLEDDIPTMDYSLNSDEKKVKGRIYVAFSELKAALMEADLCLWKERNDENKEDMEWKGQLRMMMSKLNVITEKIGGIGVQPSLMLPSGFEAYIADVPRTATDLAGRGIQQETYPRAGLSGRQKQDSSETLKDVCMNKFGNSNGQERK